MYNILFLLLIIYSTFNLLISSSDNDFKKFDNLKLNEKSYQIIHKLHVNWYMLSVKSLLAQLGKEVHHELDRVGKKNFIKCLDNIDNEGDLTESARCLIDSKNRLDKYKKTKLDFINYQKGFYRRRFVRSPYRLVDKDMTKMSSGYLSKSKPFKIRKLSSYQLLDKHGKSPIARVSDLIINFVKENSTNTNTTIPTFKWKNTLKKIQHVKNVMDEQKKLPGAKPYTFRMYDLVLENDEPTESPKEKGSFDSRAKSLLGLFFKLTGKENTKKREESNLRLLSPRIVPVMPDKARALDKKSFLSPDILSLYEEDNEITDKHQQTNSLVNVPNLLTKVGISSNDKDKLIEMLMEVSGATKSFEEANSILKALHFFETKNEIMDANERIIDSFNKLNNSLNFYQQKDMKKKGFTFIEVDQLDQLLQDQGIRNNSKMYEELSYYRNMSKKDREESLWLKIQEIAMNGTSYHNHMRFKRTLPVNILKPTVLSPYMFTPILGLSVLGPTILSPSLFSPLILNPAVLSPFILSPAIGMPFILSPYLLSPYILSPIIMAPFILNPYVLSPNILNPYVLSPLILSPLVLCPDILSPQVLGGAILSPSVLSPAIATESALMANVLSPTFLS